MIKLQDALITDGLPEIIASETWAQAMAQAVRTEMRKILEYAQNCRLYAAVDSVPEKVVDLMAFDLRVHEYKESYPLATKRALVKVALQRWSKAGTKKAVEDLCSNIFGDAHVLEWYEYDGRPHYFKVSCTNPAITEKDLTDFKRAVESIKRLSSWLDGVELILQVETMPLYTAFSLYVTTKENMELKYIPAMYSPKPMTDTTAFSLYQAEKQNLGVLDCTIEDNS